MKKEKLYSEYLMKYERYMNQYSRMEELKKEKIRLKEEEQRERISLETRKADVLQGVLEKRKHYEKQLESAKREGMDSDAIKEYSDVKLKELRETESAISRLRKEKSAEANALQKRKEEEWKELNEAKQSCEARLNELMDSGGKIPQGVNETILRQQLMWEKQRKMTDITSQYETAISQIENTAETLNAKYDQLLGQELAYIEENDWLFSVYQELNAKEEMGELPPVISASLQEPVEKVIERNNINDGKTAAKIAARVMPIDELSRYAPGWLVSFVEMGIPFIGGLVVFLIFLTSGVRFSFVSVAMNAIVTFLLWVLCAGIGFGILYGIVGALKGKTKGMIGGVLGGVAGLLAATNWTVALPAGFSLTVEWILKILICVAVIAGFWILITRSRLEGSILKLALKIGFVRKAALNRQETIIQEDLDSYYILLKSREVLSRLVESEKQREMAHLASEQRRLMAKERAAVEALSLQLDRQADEKIADEKESFRTERERYEQQQTELYQEQDACMMELAGYEERFQKMEAEFDEKIRKSAQRFNDEIRNLSDRLQKLKEGLASDEDTLRQRLERDMKNCDAEYREEEARYDSELRESSESYADRKAETGREMDRLQKALAAEFTAIFELFDRILRENPPGLKEAEGILSDRFYVFNQEEWEKLQEKREDGMAKGRQMPLKIHEIRHEKNPIVFLYDCEDSSRVATELYTFMDAVNIGLFIINCRKIFDLYIFDPVSRGRAFMAAQEKGRLTVMDDIRKLYDIINASMNFVAAKGQQMSIDEWNGRLVQEGYDEEEMKQFGRYKIVQFIVPEEESPQTTDFFSNDIWTTFDAGGRYGFLPIFYIKRSEWESALDSREKFNSKFITKLDNALGKERKNIYRIDLNSITVRKYEK